MIITKGLGGTTLVTKGYGGPAKFRFLPFKVMFLAYTFIKATIQGVLK